MLLLSRKTDQALFFGFELGDAIFPETFDTVESFRVSERSVSKVLTVVFLLPRGLKDVVKLLLEYGGLSERPVRVFLVTEYDVLKHGF